MSSNTAEPRVSTAQRIVAVAEDIIASQRFCLAVTRTDGAFPGARVMQPVRDGDFRFRLGTSARSRKLHQLRSDPRCLLVFTDYTNGAEVICECRTAVIDDEAVRRDTFLPTFRAFWPTGPDNADFCALLCTTDALEVWDRARGVAPEPYGLVSARLTRTDSGWQPA